MTRRAPDAPRSFHDDGRVVALDVHGCTSATAMRLIRRCVGVAAARGRDQVEVIHGVGGAIEEALRKDLAAVRIEGVKSFVTLSGRTVMSLPIGGRVDARRIQVSDLG